MGGPAARNLCLWVAYDGTDFHGWQQQDGQRTVQAELQAVAQSVVRHPVTISGSGRTDAGVHARGHVDAFFTSSDLACDRLRRAMQSRLPEDVTVIDACEVPPDFHPGFAARSKLYRYRILPADRKPAGRDHRRFVHLVWHPIDADRMAEGARRFVGTHDFTSMTPQSTVRRTMVRTIFRCEVERHREEIRIDVEGDGFLYRQVRTMVGTLLDVARGRWTPDDVTAILEGRDRRLAGPTAPPQGLCLMWVRYPQDRLCMPGMAAATEHAVMPVSRRLSDANAPLDEAAPGPACETHDEVE